MISWIEVRADSSWFFLLDSPLRIFFAASDGV